MSDPAYRRQLGESLEDYRRRVEAMTPPNFARSTQIDGRESTPRPSPHGPVKARRES